MLRVFIWLCMLTLGACNTSPHITTTHHNKRDKNFENIKSIINKVDSQLRDIISTARSTTDETVESAKEVEEAEEENAEALKSVKARKEKEYKERMNSILGRLKQESLSKFSKGDVKASTKRSWINRSNKCNKCKCDKCNANRDKCDVVGGVKRLCVNSDGCCNCCCQHCCFCCECEPCYHHHHRYGSLCSHRHVYDDDMIEKNNNNNNNNNKVKAVAAGAKSSNGAGKVDDKNSKVEKVELKSVERKSSAASENTFEKGKTTEKDGDKISQLENLMNNLVTEKVTEGEKNGKRCKCSNGEKSKRCKCSTRGI